MSILGKLFSGEDPQLDKGLETTKKSFFSKLSTAIAGRSTVDMDVLDDLEEVLITADVGVPTTLKIIEAIEARVAKDKYLGTDALRQILQEEIRAILVAQEKESDFSFAQDYSQQPHVIMVVGVNEKTTSIEIAHQFTQGQESGFGCSRYLPCRSHRSITSLGRSFWGFPSETRNGKRSSLGGIRHPSAVKQKPMWF